MVLGRNSYCDIHIDSGLLSRQHAEIRLEAGRLVIEDLNSTNGTYVNNMRIDCATSLMHGDVVTVGHDRFMVIAPDKNDGSTVFTYNIGQDLDEPESEDVAVAKTQMQKAFPTPLGWSSVQVDKSLEAKEVEDLLQEIDTGVQYDAHIVPALLIARTQSGFGDVYQLSLGKNKEKSAWQVGRSQFSDVRIDHPTVSNHHADLKSDESGWVIIDNKSTNGVKVNGKRIVETPCVSGDVISLGSQDFIFKIL